MPFFPRFHHHPESSSTYSVFPTDALRIFEELNNATNGTSSTGRRAFSPNFDVYETAHEYILEGEVPGLADKSQVSIEFTDDKTILVQGKIERSVKRWSDDQGRIKSIEGTEEQEKVTASGENDNKKIEKHESKTPADADKKPKYWVSERSVGEFSRSFSFPGTVDIDQCKASLEHGILKIVVPKMEKKAGRKIAVL
jgi:HSP20 family molecular chaperone IbpA